jgi:hypothetical protein
MHKKNESFYHCPKIQIRISIATKRLQNTKSTSDKKLFEFMTVRNLYKIVKVFNSLCVSAPLREIELAKSQSREEKNESSLKIVEN